MNKIEIEIDQKNERINSNLNQIWSPLRNGNIFKNYIAKKEKISDKDKNNLENDSIGLLGKCINPKKINEVNLNSTGLCFGQIQSGKTTSMEAVFCLAADNNFKILILLTGSVGPLVVQNTSRIDKVLEDRRFEVFRNVEKEWDHPMFEETLRNHIFDWNNEEIPEDEKKTLVILSMKNPSRIKKINKLFNDACSGDPSKYSKVPALIVDDECDNHSLNANASKNDPDKKDDRELYEIKSSDTRESICEMFDLDEDELYEINPGIDLKDRFEDYIGEKINKEMEDTATHVAITNLRKNFKFHSFLGYTATPNATLVINTFNNLSPSFGKIISPGEKYTGLEYFFSTQSKVDRFVRPIEKNIGEYEKNNEECAPSFRNSYLYFLTCVACALYQKRDSSLENDNMSMIVHPSGLTDTHEKYKRWIRGIQDWCRGALKDKKGERFQELKNEIGAHLIEIKKNATSKIPEIDERFWQLFQNTKCLGITPIPFNASRKEGRTRIPTVDYKRNYANILVGGQGLDRGYTVEGLTVTYLCRPLGGRQEDTLLQRARFMGYQGKNSDFLRLYFTDGVTNFFEGEYDRNKKLMKILGRFLEQNKNLKNWRRFWFGRDRSEFKLTRNGIRNDILLSSRNEPYTQSQRCRYAHILDENLLSKNRDKFEVLNNHKNSKKLSEIVELSKNHPWTVKQNIKVIQDISLKYALDEIISEFEYESRDLNKFSILMTMIDNYLDPLQEKGEQDEDFLKRKAKRLKISCPIYIFRPGEKNARKPYTKSENLDIIRNSPVTSSQGQSNEFEKNFHNDKTLFPGDIRVHWEFLNGHSNGTHSNNTPSLQIHEINVFSEKNGHGKELFSKVPYLSFFMPTVLFEEMIVGVKK
jgi:hypothetical protein